RAAPQHREGLSDWCNSNRIVVKKTIEPIGIEVIFSFCLRYCCPASIEERIANFVVIVLRTICNTIEHIGVIMQRSRPSLRQVVRRWAGRNLSCSAQN